MITGGVVKEVHRLLLNVVPCIVEALRMYVVDSWIPKLCGAYCGESEAQATTADYDSSIEDGMVA